MSLLGNADIQTLGWICLGIVLALVAGDFLRLLRRAGGRGFDIRSPLVIDGDTIFHDGRKYRLHGIDAPEMGSRAGEAAKAHLRALLEGRSIRVLPRGTDRYGRTLAVLWTGRGDVCRAMVREGYAVASRFERDYAKDERAAKRKRAGLWRRGFENPAATRARRAA